MGKVYGLTISKVFSLVASKIYGVDISSTPQPVDIDNIRAYRNNKSISNIIESKTVLDVITSGARLSKSASEITEIVSVVELVYTISKGNRTASTIIEGI